MSESVDIDDIKSRIDDIAKRGIAHIIGLYVFFDSSSDYEYRNVRDTLEPAFGKNVADKVYSQIKGAFKDIDKYARVKIEDEEIWLKEYLKKHIIERYSKIIFEEVEKRFYQMSEEDKRILSVACAIVNAIKDKEHPNLIVKRYEDGLITIYSSDFESFTYIVSSTSDFDISDIRTFIYKYLLGYQSDSASSRHDYYELKIYPFAEPYIEKLASEVSNYIRIPDKQEIKSTLEELYRKGDFLKLSVIESTVNRTGLRFISYFFGIPYEQITETVKIEGIINKGFVNPLVYDYVKEAINALYEEALKELIELFKSIFEKEGYTSYCRRECCTFTKPLEKPIHLCFLPWPKEYSLRGAEEISIKAVVIRGLPSQLLFQHLEYYEWGQRFAWLFLDMENRRIIVLLDAQRKEIYFELEKILSKYFTIEPFDLEKFKGHPSSSGIIPRR
jgi:hypothetical protein